MMLYCRGGRKKEGCVSQLGTHTGGRQEGRGMSTPSTGKRMNGEIGSSVS